MSPDASTDDVAQLAFDLARSILKIAEARDLLAELPDNADLPAPVAKQAVRLGKFQAQQQLAGSKEVSMYAGNQIQTPAGPRIVS